MVDSNTTVVIDERPRRGAYVAQAMRIDVKDYRNGKRCALPRPVHVCFVINELSSAGTETQLLALIHNLDRRLVQPYLCILRANAENSRSLEPHDCPVLNLGMQSLRHPSSISKAWQLVRFLRRERIDVVQTYFPESTYLGVLAARLAGVPRVVRTRNNLGYWMNFTHRCLGRLSAHFTDVLVANCEACRDSVVRDEGFPAHKTIVLENGVDLSRFDKPVRSFQYRDGFTKRRVGIVANLRPVKDLETFVRAAAIVNGSHPDVAFHVAGEGELRSDLIRLANDFGIGDRFFLPGSVADVPAFLAGLDVAVLCSRSEGMSNAVLEYMAAKKPIVATAVGGNTRLIEDGVHGLLVPPGDASELALAIDHILSYPWSASRLANAARRRVETRYSREAMVRRFESFYLDLVAENKNHGA